MINGQLTPTSLDCYLVMELGEDGDLFNLRSFSPSVHGLSLTQVSINVSKIPTRFNLGFIPNQACICRFVGWAPFQAFHCFLKQGNFGRAEGRTHRADRKKSMHVAHHGVAAGATYQLRKSDC